MIIACLVLHNMLIDLKDDTGREDAFDPFAFGDTHTDNMGGDLDDDGERTMGRQRREILSKQFFRKATA
jgi:hypothetical protein